MFSGPGGSTTRGIQSSSQSLAESFRVDFKTDMDLSGNGLLWYAGPQLYFQCTVCPTRSLRHPWQDKVLVLVFSLAVSTFEPITLTPNAVRVTPRNGVPMFCDTASSSNLLGMSWTACHSRHASCKGTSSDSNPSQTF